MNDVSYVKDILMEGDAALFFFSETGEKRCLGFFFWKKCRFFLKGRKEEHRTTLVKRDESERKEEEEREREFMAISR